MTHTDQPSPDQGQSADRDRVSLRSRATILLGTGTAVVLSALGIYNEGVNDGKEAVQRDPQAVERMAEGYLARAENDRLALEQRALIRTHERVERRQPLQVHVGLQLFAEESANAAGVRPQTSTTFPPKGPSPTDLSAPKDSQPPVTRETGTTIGAAERSSDTTSTTFFRTTTTSIAPAPRRPVTIDDPIVYQEGSDADSWTNRVYLTYDGGRYRVLTREELDGPGRFKPGRSGIETISDYNVGTNGLLTTTDGQPFAQAVVGEPYSWPQPTQPS